MDDGQRILALRRDVERTAQLRMTATAHRQVAERQLAEVDERLKSLGIDPDHADIEIAALEGRITSEVAILQQQVTAEIASYNDIISSTRAVVERT